MLRVSMILQIDPIHVIEATAKLSNLLDALQQSVAFSDAFDSSYNILDRVGYFLFQLLICSLLLPHALRCAIPRQTRLSLI